MSRPATLGNTSALQNNQSNVLPKEKDTEIPDRMLRLSQSLSRQRGLLERLRCALAPVSRAFGEIPPCGSAPSTTELGGAIQGSVNELDQNNYLLDAMLEALEL